MNFTRTIRTKLLVSVGIVLSMLLVQAGSGIYGLSSFRKLVRDLDYSITRAPHPSDLVAAATALLEPLLLHVDSEQAAAFQQRILDERLAKMRQEVLEFRRKLEEMSTIGLPGGQRPLTDVLLAKVDERLEQLRTLQAGLHGPRRADVMATMLEHMAHLQVLAHSVPDPVQGPGQMLVRSRDVYRSTLTLVWTTTAIGIVLFAGMVHAVYSWVFRPILKLHQGALRVAQGDFNYRVKVTTSDEMSELAEAFNKMTVRFQEVAGNLDRQVQQRCQQLVRSERLAGVGFLAAGVAHEINNPLSAIAMAAESLTGRIGPLLEHLPPDEQTVVGRYLQLIEDESFRCKQITERLLDFARGRDATREPTDIARLVSEVIAMVQYLSKYREKRIEYAPGLPCFAEVNGPEIKQVILNLVANGLEAMEPGGSLRISLQEQTDSIELTFVDQGCGMTPDVLDNIFEPFFTQKQGGQGTGLGLSISHRIMSQHGGAIHASSRGPGQGSTFNVRLPRHALPASGGATIYDAVA